MKSLVALFIVTHGGGAPEPERSFEVEASSDDLLRARVADTLIERGLRVRAISFGPRGITAYAERAS
jgi:hypothetical protein